MYNKPQSEEGTYERKDFDDYDQSELLDAIVPCACIYECVAEPDGHCEHGNPSVLLDWGLI